MLTHLDLVILTKVNELAERFGVPPSSFLATVQTNRDPKSGPLTSLSFESAPTQDSVTDAYDAMLDLIGGSIADHMEMTAPPAVIVSVLEAALHCAPKSRTRGHSQRTGRGIPETC